MVWQALALREQLTLARQAGHPQNPEQVLTAGQLKGYSNRIQREAAKVLELPYSLVRGVLLSLLTFSAAQLLIINRSII